MPPTPPTPLPSNFFRTLRNIFNGVLATILNTTRDAADAAQDSADDKLPRAGGVLTGDLTSESVLPRYNFHDTDGPTDETRFRWFVAGGFMILSHVTDDLGAISEVQSWRKVESSGDIICNIRATSTAFTGGISLGGNVTMSANNIFSLGIIIYDAGPQDLAGSGTPEAAVTAPVGSTYRRAVDGGAGTSFYVKESGAGNTGWVAK